MENMKTVFEVVLCWADEYIKINEFDLRRMMMKLSEYFEKTKGQGVFATADSKGKVGTAVYARPHFMNEKTVAFIMADRLMHKNLQSNPNASYLFMESKERYVGKRFYLTKIKEEKDSALINKIRRRESCPVDESLQKTKSDILSIFRIDKVLPLIGAKIIGSPSRDRVQAEISQKGT